MFILAAIDYFSRCVEAISLREVGAKQVADFIRTHLIYRYGVPYKIISDNSLYFKNQVMIKLAEKYKFRHSFSLSYNSTSNGQAETFNKVLCKILKKMVSRSRRDWHERLLDALWVYRTTVRIATSWTPYNLVFGSEVVLPLKVQLDSLRVAMQFIDPNENAQVRLAELEVLDEQRLMTQQRFEIYQAQMAEEFNKRVKFCSFDVRDLVFTIRSLIIINRKTQGKFASKWEGPYVVTKIFPKGAYELLNHDDKLYILV